MGGSLGKRQVEQYSRQQTEPFSVMAGMGPKLQELRTARKSCSGVWLAFDDTQQHCGLLNLGCS
jgi:hypothetical protein